MKFYTTSKLSDNIHETPEGFLVCVGVPIARTGEMLYGPGETPLEPDGEGKVIIDREEEEVFRPETMASFEGKAVTITHPTDFVSPENWSRLAKGVIQNVRRGEGEQENDLIADLLITDSVAINLVKNGLREVSCGYDALYEQTGAGRGLQKKILGNHLALVDEGRAGSAYAINDHKGKGSQMKLKDRIKAVFAKAQDEAMAMADEAEKEKPAKDASEGDKEKPAKKDESKDAASYDELKQMVADLGEKIASMGKSGKDASTKATENEPAKVDAEDEESEGESSLEDRLKALEASVAKLLEKKAEAGDEDAEEGEESEDEGSEDDDFEESTMTGDTASRIEILAPGLKVKGVGKDAKVKALLASYATKDGKAVIDQFTGGKSPNVKDEARVNTLFIAASEVLKVTRTSEFAGTKQTRDFNSGSETPKGAMTAEQLNAINAKHYGNK